MATVFFIWIIRFRIRSKHKRYQIQIQKILNIRPDWTPKYGFSAPLARNRASQAESHAATARLTAPDRKWPSDTYTGVRVWNQLHTFCFIQYSYFLNFISACERC